MFFWLPQQQLVSIIIELALNRLHLQFMVITQMQMQ